MSIKIKIHKSDERGNVCQTLFPNRIEFGEESFVIPKGFESDGASVPRFFWRLVCPPLDPCAVRAGICHDFVYRTGIINWTRLKADVLLFCFLIEDGMPIWKAFLSYVGVRCFGWIAWNKKTNGEKK